jgi:uncharacterized membrane protein
MKVIIEYIICFFICALFGWIYEKIILKRNIKKVLDLNFCDDIILKKLHLCLPLINIYGLGGVLLLFVKKNIILNNIFVFSLISGILLTILECIGGKICLMIHNDKLWDYSRDYMNFCDSFCSLRVFIIWIIMSVIFFKSYDYLSKFYKIEK